MGVILKLFERNRAVLMVNKKHTLPEILKHKDMMIYSLMEMFMRVVSKDIKYPHY